MKITKIKIENFKSIKEVEFDLKKYGNSYTTILVGVNESGKSNILKAMSYFNTPEEKYDYSEIRNQKNDKNDPVDLWFHLSFDNNSTCVSELRKEIDNGELLDFEIVNIVKNVYLEDGDEYFSEDYKFEVEKLTQGLFIKRIQKGAKTTQEISNKVVHSFYLSKEYEEEDEFEELTQELFEEYFKEKIQKIIKRYEPKVSFWTPSEEYLVSEVDLNVFKDNVKLNIPLRHIFYIAGFEDPSKIKTEINRISNDTFRSKLESKLGKEATKYVKSIWKHNIIITIKIEESFKCKVYIRDEGKANEHDFHKMNARSEGFKQFMSLILSLSVEAKFPNVAPKLILIDEPEAHLHPAGIRDLRNELLAIGENNFLFVSTHSPFLVDRHEKRRNIIIKKNNKAETEKVLIGESTNIIDDEVLAEAFGIDVYKDLLNPHSILVEGASDKLIIQKALIMKEKMNYGITNGYGSNVNAVASKLNDTDISLLVLLDDDSKGREYKEKIVKIGASYSDKNVFTIRDIVGGIVSGGTIEDTLGEDFLRSKIVEVSRNIFLVDDLNFEYDDRLPVLPQIRKFLNKLGKTNKEIDNFIDELKVKISNDFNPSKSSFKEKFPLLSSLCDGIIMTLEHTNVRKIRVLKCSNE